MSRPDWPYGAGHRFTPHEARRIRDHVHSYAYRWGLIGVAPLEDVKRARRARHTDSGFDGWEHLHSTVKPIRLLSAVLADAKGGAYLPTWLELRRQGFRPIVDGTGAAWHFRDGTVPLDYRAEIEPLPIRRGIASISRWTWCRGCDSELAVTVQGWCEWCVVAPVSDSPDDTRPIGAPVGYVPEATL